MWIIVCVWLIVCVCKLIIVFVWMVVYLCVCDNWGKDEPLEVSVTFRGQTHTYCSHRRKEQDHILGSHPRTTSQAISQLSHCFLTQVKKTHTHTHTHTHNQCLCAHTNPHAITPPKTHTHTPYLNPRPPTHTRTHPRTHTHTYTLPPCFLYTIR